VPATQFLGRERELAEVVDLLAREEVRLLTLTGPPGTGKTRLALQAAAEASESFRDGIWWVPLAPLQDPSLLVSTVAQTLDVREQPAEEIATTLTTHLAGKRALLLLDNAEHLLPDVAAEITRLRDADGPTMLVTSRERLQLQGERLWDVPPLDEDEGVDLFTTRARALDPRFVANSAVAGICERLDNLPLALELAAARTRLFTPQQVLERLAQRLDLLKGGRDAEPRQQTLRATIDWSHELLSEEDRRLFRRLSVFTGGCTYVGAEEVCGAGPDTLQSLIDKSLLRRRDTDFGARYWMLETIHDFAAERLRAEGEAQDVRRSHADYFLERLEQVHQTVQTREWMRLAAPLAPEIDNVRSAVSWALEAGEKETALRLAWASDAVRPRMVEIAQWLDDAMELEGQVDPVVLGHALRDAGSRWYVLGELRKSRRLHERSLRLFRELGHAAGEAAALRRLGVTLRALGDRSEGMRCLERCLELADELSPEELYKALHALGEAERAGGDPHRGAELLERAATLAHARGDYFIAAHAFHGLGDEAFDRGDWRSAEQQYAKALALAAEVRAEQAISDCLAGLAAVAAETDRVVRAGQLWGAMCAVEQETGVRILDFDRERYERSIADFADPSFITAEAAGRTMSTTSAIDYALSQH
jgi:predicted ATPase